MSVVEIKGVTKTFARGNVTALENIELEVVLGEDEPTEVGMAIARDLLAQLGISPSQLIEGAYVDLAHA